MSNPWNEGRNMITTGRIISKNPVPFGDEMGKGQHNIVKHSAKISTGSSGSALLNRDLEIIGINLGGGQNVFPKFVHGKAMPSDRILDFLEDMEIPKQE